MEELYQNVLRKAALGLLLQGHIHNMSGPLQILSMQIEIINGLFDNALRELPEEVQKNFYMVKKKCQQMIEPIERLREVLNSLTEDIEESPATIDLNIILKKEVTFWEGDLIFKHEVEKRWHLHPSPLMLFMPPAILNQGLCALFWSFVPELSQQRGKMEISSSDTPEGPQAILSFPERELNYKNDFLKIAQEILAPYAKIDLTPKKIILGFRKK